MKFIFPGVALLSVAVAVLFTNRIKKPLIVLSVLCLQAEYTTIIADRGESSWVGGSGPSGIFVPFTAVVFVVLFIYDCFVNLNRTRYEWFRAWITVPTIVTLLAAAGTTLYTPEPMRAVFWLQEPVLAYIIFLVALNTVRTHEDISLVMSLLMATVVVQAVV